MSSPKLSRRDFLRTTGLFSAAMLFAGPAKVRPISALMDEMPPDMFMPDAEIDLTAAAKDVQILSGAQTHVWSYSGALRPGSTGVTVTNIPGCYLGPIIRARSGTKVRLYFHNNLAETSVVHPHGLHVPEECDG